ncbi:MAG: endolytic transglycosylase MltG [Legionellales bacterium]|nr:endolytic transglycosylase MltG [Legionellales bacterium]
MITRRRCIAVTVYGLALLTVIGVLLGLELYRIVYRPIPIQNNESVIIRVEKSTTATALVRMMYAQGWIHSIRLWSYLIRVQDLSGKLRAGIYQVQSGESVQDLIYRIVAGDVLRKNFMIRPGTTVSQISKDLQAAPYLDYQASDWAPLRAQHANPEGLLLADTYLYDGGSGGQVLLQRAHSQLDKVLAQAWQKRNPILPYQDPYELLIVASILEKEAALPKERRLISGVIVNRLKNHMMLQMDPTVIYGLGEAYQGTLTHQQMTIDSPYNTYLYKGLPPTPIAMVSVDAIDAASHPEVSAYLYFVAKGDGTHEFNTTYAKHREAINQYMRK